MDRSDHGAVLCIWQIFIEMRQGLNICAPGQTSSVRAELDRSIAATNAFIVRNSPTPVTLAEVEARVRAFDAQADAGYAKLAPDPRAKACSTSWAAQSAARLTSAELRRQTARRSAAHHLNLVL